MDNTQDHYTIHYQRYESAKETHRKKYELSKTKPEKPNARKHITWHHFVVGLILVASTIVSASHTLPVVFESYSFVDPIFVFPLVISTFVMVELAAIYWSYTRILKKHDDGNKIDIDKPLKFGVYLSVGAIFAFNGYGVLDTGLQLSGVVWEFVRLIIFFWVACIAPASAWLSGENLAIQSIKINQMNEQLMKQYEQDLEKWNADLENDWNSNMRNYGIKIKVDKPKQPQLQSGVGNVPQIPKNVQNGNKLESALEHYRKHPNDVKVSPNRLARQLGISKTYMYQARDLYYAEIGEDNETD